MITTVSSCMWGEQLPVRAQLRQICPLISSAAWVRRAEHEGFLAFCSVELAELIRMTVTSASAQRKGQWLRLDARQFSRQLENNTMKAHSIHAAGTEALPTGTSREDVPVEGRRLEEDSTRLACHCPSFIPILTLHSEGMSSSVTVHCLCHPASTKNFSLPTCFLATVLGVHPSGLGVSVTSVPWCGKSCRALCWCVGRVLGVPFPPHAPNISMLQVSRPCCYCFYILQSL